jgi:predicted naringenin-chalcone synthase
VRTWLAGIGTAVPQCQITQNEALALATKYCHCNERERRILRAIYRSSGIQSRAAVAIERLPAFYDTSDSRGPGTETRMQWFTEFAAPIASSAAKISVQRSEIDPRQITDLVTVSCTGFSAPGFDVSLIKSLGLSPETSRTNVGFMGCHGALNGLRVVDGLLSRGGKRTALMVAVELCSLHFQSDPSTDSMMANALFADGAAAATFSNSKDSGVSVAALGSCVFPFSESLMSWNIRDRGFAMTLSTELPDLLREKAKPWIEAWLLAQGIRLEQVQSWAIHPGGPRIIDAIAESLNLDSAQTTASREILSEHGNMSSPTVFFVVEKLQRRPDWLPCVMLAFGPGITVEAALLTAGDNRRPR